MPNYYYKTNGEEVKCVNCGFTEFVRHEQIALDPKMIAYECARCHFTALFPEAYAPTETKP